MTTGEEEPAATPGGPRHHLFESNERVTVFGRRLDRLLYRTRAPRRGFFYLFAGVGFFSIHASEATLSVVGGFIGWIVPWVDSVPVRDRDLEAMFLGLLAWAAGHYMWSTSRRLDALHDEVVGHRAGPPPLPLDRGEAGSDSGPR